MILTLQTTTFGFHGGIPAYNRIVCRALNSISKKSIVLVAMDDSGISGAHAVDLPNLTLSGFGGKRFAFAIEAIKTVLREPVTVLLAGHVNYAPLCLLMKLLRPRIKFGVFIYGCEVWETLSYLRRRALKSADFIVSISEYTKRRAVEANDLEPQCVSVLPNALEWDGTDTELVLEGYSAPKTTELLSVGRLDGSERQKGFDDVIRALPIVASKVPGVRYKVVGTGTDLERHKELATSMGMSDRVDFLGALSTQSLHSCYQHCDVFVMPSAQEGFGFVYLEAMQYRKPVVAALCGGAPEVVEDGVTGRLVEYGNPTQLAETITELCSDSDLRLKLGRAGHQRLQEKFTFPRFQDNFRKILSQQGAMNGS